MKIIGISGKIGSGKNYLAEQLVKELHKLGYTTEEASFASSLRNELNRIIKTIKVDVIDETPYDQIIQHVQEIHRMGAGDAETLFEMMVDDIVNIEGLNAYSRTESIRRALQFLGTDIRRKTDNQYWVNAFHKNLPEADFIIVTDVRFPNEADSIINNDGVMLRLNISQELINERIKNRDGLKYSDEALTHPSELALDAYNSFDYIVTDGYNPHDIAAFIINYDERFNRIAEQGV